MSASGPTSHTDGGILPLHPPVQPRVSLRALNTFGLPAVADHLVRVARESDVRQVVDHPQWGRAPKFILGGGSNVVFTRDVERLVIKVEVMGRRVVQANESGVLIEVSASEGGTESQDWAQMVLRMYTRYAESQGWRGEVMSESPNEIGGYKEIVLRVEGDDVYGQLRFESGGHRVQRVPATESQGRIHTSACTVAVMPEPDEAEEIELNPADLRIDTYRASGAGGQHINKTDSAVRLTHIPTGIVVQCQDSRSQHSNRDVAWKRLRSRLYDHELRKRQAEQQKLEDELQTLTHAEEIKSELALILSSASGKEGWPGSAQSRVPSPRPEVERLLASLRN